MADRVLPLDDDARRVLTWAQDEARQHRSTFLGAEHLLLGLLDLPRSDGARILAALVPSLVDLRLAVETTLAGSAAQAGWTGAALSRDAKRVIERAAAAADEDASKQIGSENFLLALIEHGGVAAVVLQAFGATSDAATSLIRLLRGGGALPDNLARPRDPALLRAALDSALAALRTEAAGGEGDISADELRDAAVRADHLARLIDELPDEPDAPVDLATRLAAAPPNASEAPRAATVEPEARRAGANRFDKFSGRATRVLTLAQEEAQRFNHNYIGTEHLLLGLAREGEGVAAKVLANLGVELNKVRSAVEFIIGHGDRPVPNEIGLTPRARKVIELAVDEASRLNHGYIGTEHLLLGLVREGEGIAAGVLESLGVNLERVRAETIRVLAQQQPGTPPGRQLGEAQELQERLRDSRSQPLEKQASAPDLSAVDAAPQTPDPLLGLARMQARVADLQSRLRWQQAVEQQRSRSRAEPTASPAVVLAREIVKALDALRQARTAAETVGQRGYADGLRQIEARLRALVAASATTLTPDAAAAGATPETKQAEPPASQEELALRPLIELRRAAEATRRFRRAAALDDVISELEPLAFEDSPGYQEAHRLVLQAGATLHFAPLVSEAWEAQRLERARYHLAAARLTAMEREDEPAVLLLCRIIVALRSLPNEDDGEGVAIPAVPPPKPPFSARAEQRLDA